MVGSAVGTGNIWRVAGVESDTVALHGLVLLCSGTGHKRSTDCEECYMRFMGATLP
jgi:hypothetical protein